ncbi:MAG: hypothetical protein HY706_14445, partial [Candidatus Hydrogenedentes bacterium]|nr:hypothetical protein [Candidatus Hydrogenedentota bacterium]
VDGERVEATLALGINKILIKVLQGGGDWQFCVRATDRDGKPLDLTMQRQINDIGYIR